MICDKKGGDAVAMELFMKDSYIFFCGGFCFGLGCVGRVEGIKYFPQIFRRMCLHNVTYYIFF